MDTLSTGSLSGAQKEELMDQVKQQIAIANAQELLTKMSEKCFKKCIYKPGTALDNSEQKCIAMCMDRYMDAWNLVSRTYSSRIQRERNNMWKRRTKGCRPSRRCKYRRLSSYNTKHFRLWVAAAGYVNVFNKNVLGCYYLFVFIDHLSFVDIYLGKVENVLTKSQANFR